MSDHLAVIREYIQAHEAEMLELLERIVRINSYTPNKAGTDAVGAVLRGVMEEAGFTVRVDAQTEVGDNLVAESPACASGGKRILLCGHMDTVFPDDGSFDCFRPEEHPDGDRIIGPGVIDMKGGLVVGIYALKALDHAGLLKDIPVAFLFNSDEEIGSPHSHPLVVEEAKKAFAAFVFECAGPNGEVVTGRKAKISFSLSFTGQSGHAGNLTGPKASAVLELAHKTVAIEALNSPEKNLSVNVGVVSGGLGPNTVAPSAEAKVESRYVAAEDGQQLEQDIRDLAAYPTIPGTTCTVETIPGRPPMETSEGITQLHNMVAEVGQSIGQTIGTQYRGGVSDANFIAHAGTPVLDGLGPVGNLDHSPNEFMVTSSLVGRTLLSALSIRKAFEEMGN